MRTVEAHARAVGAGADAVFRAEEFLHRVRGEVIVLRTDDDAELRRRAEIEPDKLALVALARGVANERQPVARHQRPALPAAEAAAQIGRDAAEHRRDVEAAFDRHVEHRAAGERADAHHLAAPQPHAAHGSDARAA